MKLSLYLPTGTSYEFAGHDDPVAAFETMRELACTADELGFETVWAPDHVIPFGPAGPYVFEVWTTLAALARETTRVKLGQLVSGNGYRNPALLAKMGATLDVISGGRLCFGIGAGWYGAEYRAFGYDFPSAPERLRRLDEALQLITSLWTKPATEFDGEFYRASGAVISPLGAQPHIPIMVAGGGEKVTLKLVARYGDMCNVLESPDELSRKYRILAEHCGNLGRDFAAISKTATTYCRVADSDEQARAALPPALSQVFPGDLASYGLVGTIDTIRERLAAYERAGVDELIVAFHDALSTDTLRAFAAEFIR